MLSNTIATIPNYYTYAAFKTGFTDGLGPYTKCLDYNNCGDNDAEKRRTLKSGLDNDKDKSDCDSDVRFVDDRNNNDKYMSPSLPVSCDWFDAYSVNTRLNHYTCYPGISRTTSGFDEEYNEEIEELYTGSLETQSRSDYRSDYRSASHHTDKCSYWNDHGNKDRFRYSTRKGCIDWLESCDCQNVCYGSYNTLGVGNKTKFKGGDKNYHNYPHCDCWTSGRSSISKHSSKTGNSGFLSKSDNFGCWSRVNNSRRSSRAGYLGLKDVEGMNPMCPHLQRKLATDNSSCEDVRTVNSGELGEATLDEEVFEEELYYLGPPSKPNGNGFLDGQGLVTIRMIPDEQGRFGFNVKGGVDQGMPIIVSRVAPNTPADNAIPRLNEGDQVLFINGRDVSQHTHEQVVMFIRASRETHSGELVLKVRPNAYSGDDQSEEPDFVYDPETHQISSASSGANALEMSLKLLEESLESGAALAQFEQLYRKKPGMTMNTARLETNVNKNRYRDISPYDQTRVILKSNNGDYINANYVNMEIPVSGIVNRYIAAQGPLPTTCTDFWQMIWEQQSTLVIMLTTKVERGRVKCHQYWPDLYETSDYGHLQITCVKEEESASFAFREFNLTHVESQEERHISHMQYIAWPDHGVPDDPADFLDFVIKVRQKRVGLVEPSVVHCSAGIGRTGVLITMETAMCLIEANQAVYPLSIVRQMRDQRAMLIQTPNQYKFVCEAIIRCFQEGIVKPLPDYQQR